MKCILCNQPLEEDYIKEVVFHNDKEINCKYYDKFCYEQYVGTTLLE